MTGIHEEHDATTDKLVYDGCIKVVPQGQIGSVGELDGGIAVINTLNDRTGLLVYSDNASSTARPLARIYMDNASSSQEVLNIVNHGSGTGFNINQDGNGYALNIDSEATTYPSLLIDQTVANGSLSVNVKHGGSNIFGLRNNTSLSGSVCLALGSGTYQRWLWVDSTGDLRISATSTAPSNDLSGSVVGAQS